MTANPSCAIKVKKIASSTATPPHGSSTWYRSDRFLAVIAMVLVLLVYFTTDLIQSLERKAYDLAVSFSGKTPYSDLAVIAVDDRSISNIGRWPWSRDVHAKLIDKLNKAGAKQIVETVFFFEPQADQGLHYIEQLALLQQQAEQNDPALAQGKMAEIIREAKQTLDADSRLVTSISNAGNVILPNVFDLRAYPNQSTTDLPDFGRQASFNDNKGKTWALQATAVQWPLSSLAQAAAGIGHLNALPDEDGTLRSEPLLIEYQNRFYPSLAMVSAMKIMDIKLSDLKLDWGNRITMGKQVIQTDSAMSMLTRFYQDQTRRPAFSVDSFFDVYNDAIPQSKFAGKTVLIGATASGVGTSQITPISSDMPPVLSLAHSISTLVQGDNLVAPGWGIMLEWGLAVAALAYLALALPQLTAARAATITFVFTLGLLVTHHFLISQQGLWLPMMLPVVILLVGHLLLTTHRYLVTEKGKQQSDAESAESNRLLGLAFQSQGQLDIAFDKFRLCPMEPRLMENLYNLASDFERKRLFNKAYSVYAYLTDHDPNFRDAKEKLDRTRQLSESMVFSSVNSLAKTQVLLNNHSGMQKPMLGRYQIDKEIGKGAMGVVYLGQDPKLNRRVAIKTLALGNEFDGEELEEVKQRFFREAETVGRLHHPYIVTIFDAGEEEDLAYIAMEFLQGESLSIHTRADKLLPLKTVVDICSRVAEALHYAHTKHVVHRDIKPANIMYEAATDTVKVTDFGVARITDSTRTKTGLVLGTPSYMSPEQLAGKRIDGRSDLFSLTVSLYQLCTGKLPFIAESMTQLMFKIANETPADIRKSVEGIPEELVAIIEKGLDKLPSRRFQDGEEMAFALREVMNRLPDYTI